MKSDWKTEPLIVLDACALIAFLNDEPGADVVESILQLDQSVLEIAARLKASFRISLADSIALALAVSRDVPLASSDHHEFDALESAGIARFFWIR